MAQRMSFTASDDLHRALGEAAEREGIKVAQYVREALVARLASGVRSEDRQVLRELTERMDRLEEKLAD